MSELDKKIELYCSRCPHGKGPCKAGDFEKHQIGCRYGMIQEIKELKAELSELQEVYAMDIDSHSKRIYKLEVKGLDKKTKLTDMMKVKIVFEDNNKKIRFKQEVEVTDVKNINTNLDDIISDLEFFIIDKYNIEQNEFYDRLYLE